MNERLDGVGTVGGALPFSTFQAAIEGLLKTEVPLKT
jgi:hypothetical protein